MADSCLSSANCAVKIMHWLGTNPGSEGVQKQREKVPVPPPGIDITTKPFEFFCLKEGPQPGG